MPTRGCRRTSSRIVCAGILVFLSGMPALAEPCRPYDTVVRELQADNQALALRWLADSGAIIEVYISRKDVVTTIAIDRRYCTVIVSNGEHLVRYFPFNGT